MYIKHTNIKGFCDFKEANFSTEDPVATTCGTWLFSSATPENRLSSAFGSFNYFHCPKESASLLQAVMIPSYLIFIPVSATVQIRDLSTRLDWENSLLMLNLYIKYRNMYSLDCRAGLR